MEQFQILQIKELALKVHIHCNGCKRKVKKVLKKIEGVYYVEIDAEQQKVKVYGNVDSATPIKKLVKSGKYAQLWPTSDQQIPSFINGGIDQDLIQNLINSPKSQSLLTPRGLEDQMSFERYLKQSMNMKNMGWDDNDRSLNGENESGFVDQQGSQLGGLQSYHDHDHHYQSSMPMMNMYQQSYPSPMMMNMNMNMNKYMHGNMGNVMIHDNMYPQSYPSPMMMNMNMNMNMHGSMGNVMMHDNMYMHQPYMPNHVFPMVQHTPYADYY